VDGGATAKNGQGNHLGKARGIIRSGDSRGRMSKSSRKARRHGTFAGRGGGEHAIASPARGTERMERRLEEKGSITTSEGETLASIPCKRKKGHGEKFSHYIRKGGRQTSTSEVREKKGGSGEV